MLHDEHPHELINAALSHHSFLSDALGYPVTCGRGIHSTPAAAAAAVRYTVAYSTRLMKATRIALALSVIVTAITAQVTVEPRDLGFRIVRRDNISGHHEAVEIGISSITEMVRVARLGHRHSSRE